MELFIYVKCFIVEYDFVCKKLFMFGKFNFLEFGKVIVVCIKLSISFYYFRVFDILFEFRNV